MEKQKFRKLMKLLFGTNEDRELFNQLTKGRINDDNRSDLFYFENACRVLYDRALKTEGWREDEWFDECITFIPDISWQKPKVRKDWADKFLNEIRNAKKSEGQAETSRIRGSSK